MNQQNQRSIRLIFSIPVFGGTKREVLESATEVLKNLHLNSLYTIFTPNPEQIVAIQKYPWLLSCFKESSVNLPDGQGLVWAMERKYNEYSFTRIPGREVFHDLLQRSLENHWKVFLLGGKEGSAQQIVDSYLKRQPKLDWQWDGGANDIQFETPEEHAKVLAKISTHRPEILFVAYGAPWQERWILDNREKLQSAGVKLAMVVGGSFEYEAGKVPRVFPIVSKLKLEWLQRLIFEPWRWKRQLTGLQFFLWVLQGKG